MLLLVAIFIFPLTSAHAFNWKYLKFSVGPSVPHETTGSSSDRWVINQNDFFDYEFAKHAFYNFENFSDLDNGFDPEFLAWEKKYRGKPQDEALRALQNDPNSEKIRQAHDLQWIYIYWYESQLEYIRPRSRNAVFNWQGWNKWTEESCSRIAKRNSLFEGCKIPDWRTQNEKIEDLNQISLIRGAQKKDVSSIEDILADETLDANNRKALEELLAQLKGQ